MWDKIAEHITRITGEKFQIDSRRSVGGGCINQACEVACRNRTYFIKLNRAADIAMFEAEAVGLRQMWETGTIRIPQPVCSGTEGDSAYLVLEWLDLGGSAGTQGWEKMGQQLAQMHRHTSPAGRGFGWDINNTIGSTPQINSWTAGWAQFWAEHRIGFQLKLANRRGGQFRKGERLLEAIPKLLSGYQPQPSLVHGDLWGGNAAFTAKGEPVIFDPATYFGDREVDLAMTELFGGFPAAFYRGYSEVWPLDEGYPVRKTLYNLYHILNHFNLFGGGYASQAERMIEQLLGNIGG